MITLKTLHKASEQEVFDQVARHLLAQGKQSKHLGSCVYRGQEGTKCAAGCLMSDFEYEEQFENQGWKRLVHENLVPGVHVNLIHALQVVHDNHDPEEWLGKLRGLAWKFKLSDDVLAASAGCPQQPL